jgi:serine/threonine protein kinase
MHTEPAILSEPSRSQDLSQCPSDEELLAYLPGELSDPAAASVATHLATCQLCQSRITTLKQKLSDRPPADGKAEAVRDAPGDMALSFSDSPTTLVHPIRPRTPRRLGEYELLEPIGRGGMGIVYRARHVRLQRIVAVKVLPNLQLADDSAIIRMQRESAAAGRVRHPNIVFATDAGESGGIHYLVMEHVEGTDLSKLVAALGPLPVADACEIVRQAALGLAHIAACGLVHRDLKPSNVMLAADGTVKILDLGLARLHPQAIATPLDDAEPTQAGYLLGTADYIAPEQIDSPHDADVRSDLYSLGCTFYRLLAGRAPFGGPGQNSVSKKVAAHRHEEPPPIRSLRDDVPVAVETLLSSLLAKRPGDRCQRPLDLAEALSPLARDADLQALLQRLRERAEIDHWPLLDPACTPASTNATTRSMNRTATSGPPLRSRTSTAAWLKLAAAASVLALLIAVVYAATRGEWSPVVTPRVPTRPFLPAVPAAPPATATTTIYDVSGPVSAITWIGFRRSPTPEFIAERKMLECRPDSFQLIALGEYDGRPGTFTATINQAHWHGDAGIFFGCRPEPKLTRPALTTFQLFEFEHFEAEGNVDELFRLARQRAMINVDPTQLRCDLETKRVMAFTRPLDANVTLQIAFGAAGCEKVTVNGQPLDDLCTAELNKAYFPADYRGTFGLYCAAGRFANASGVPYGPTWFGNIEFAPAE